MYSRCTPNLGRAQKLTFVLESWAGNVRIPMTQENHLLGRAVFQPSTILLLWKIIL